MEKTAQHVFDKEIVENVAKTISAHFDYPWEFMQEQGRDDIRKLAENILCTLPSSYEENAQLLAALKQMVGYVFGDIEAGKSDVCDQLRTTIAAAEAAQNRNLYNANN